MLPNPWFQSSWPEMSPHSFSRACLLHYCQYRSHLLSPGLDPRIVFYAVLGDHPSRGLTSHGKHVKRVNSHLRCAKYVAEIVFVRPGLKSMSWPKQFLNAWKKMTSSTLRLPLLSRRCLVSQSNNGGQRSCECCDNWQWTLSMLRVSCD